MYICMYIHVYIISYFIIISYYFITGILIGYSMVVLLLRLSFVGFVAVTLSILVVVIIVIIISYENSFTISQGKKM